MSLKAAVTDILMKLFSLSYPGFHQTNLYFTLCSNAVNPEVCLSNHFAQYTYYQRFKANCTDTIFGGNCEATITLNRYEKIVSISFKGPPNIDRFMETRLSALASMPLIRLGSDMNNTYAGRDFSRAFEILWATGFADSLKELMYQFCDYKIIVRSHSIGGCIAQLSIVRMKYLHPDWKIYYFATGCPRCGDVSFANKVTLGTVVAVRSNWEDDYVTGLPSPCWDTFSTLPCYHHCCDTTHSYRLLFGLLSNTKTCSYSEDLKCTGGRNRKSHSSAWYTEPYQYSSLLCGKEKLFKWEDKETFLNF